MKRLAELSFEAQRFGVCQIYCICAQYGNGVVTSVAEEGGEQRQQHRPSQRQTDIKRVKRQRKKKKTFAAPEEIKMQKQTKQKT